MEGTAETNEYKLRAYGSELRVVWVYLHAYSVCLSVCVCMHLCSNTIVLGLMRRDARYLLNWLGETAGWQTFQERSWKKIVFADVAVFSLASVKIVVLPQYWGMMVSATLNQHACNNSTVDEANCG